MNPFNVRHFIPRRRVAYFVFTIFGGVPWCCQLCSIILFKRKPHYLTIRYCKLNDIVALYIIPNNFARRFQFNGTMIFLSYSEICQYFFQYHQCYQHVVYGCCGFDKSNKHYTQIIFYDGIVPLISNCDYNSQDKLTNWSWIISFSILAIHVHM